MDRNLVERMIGAGVLILLVVLLAPVLLDGSRDDESAPAVVTLPEPVLRTETIYLNGTEPPPAARHQAAPTAPVDLPLPAETQPVTVEPVQRPAPVAVSKAAPAAVTAEGSESARGDWGVQLGSFANKDNAKRLVNDLVKLGFPAHVSATIRGGRDMYRVRVGPSPSRDSATELARTLATAGHSGMVMAFVDKAGD